MSLESRRSTALVFISWAPFCSRSDSIAIRLGGHSYMVYAPFWGSSYGTIIIKYLVQAVRTLLILMRERPRVVLVMSPPVVACAPIWLYSLITRTSYAIDAHTAAFVDPRWHRVRFLHRFFSRKAVTTIVTNNYLKSIVEAWGAHATIVSDVPVHFSDPERVDLRGQCRMTLISTFTKDEPLEPFFRAASTLPEVNFYVTGGYESADQRLLRHKPDNVELTGFLPDSRYVGLLKASDAILSLTTLDHTMQRGAYEAVYLGKPVVTSNFQVLRECFSRGTVHVDNTAEDIARGIRLIKERLPQYQEEVLQLRSEKLNQWEKKRTELIHLLALS
jgi:glycosyltransferase involved in cell wall biosynthesis